MPNDTTDRSPALAQNARPGSQAATIPSAADTCAPHSSSKLDELRLLLNSRTPLITVETSEEDRLTHLLQSLADELLVPLYVWSVTCGLDRSGGTPLYNSAAPEQALANIAEIHGDAIFLLKDFARYCENDVISRRLRDLTDRFRSSRRSIVLSGASIQLPPELQSESAPFHFGLPGERDLLPCVNQVLAEMSHSVPVTLDAPAVARIARNLVGFTQDEAARTLRKCILASGHADASLADSVAQARRESLPIDGLLEQIPADRSFADIAGLQHLRDWCAKRRSALTPEGQRFGLAPPKGVLITGVQGCGKSLAARSIAAEWRIDLVRLDPGAFYDKYIGESEKHVRKTLDLAQKLAPVVLWIDEIEKAFASGAASSDSDAGLSQRVLGILLTWMQDREGGVFLAATSNDIAALPPEMVRKGRFDEIFFVDLPQPDVRSALFALHLKKRGRDPAAFDLTQLASATGGFSGAEIEQAIVSGLYTAFSEKAQLSTQILLREIHETQPLSVLRAEDIQALREWARSRARPAD